MIVAALCKLYPGVTPAAAWGMREDLAMDLIEDRIELEALAGNGRHNGPRTTSHGPRTDEVEDLGNGMRRVRIRSMDGLRTLLAQQGAKAPGNKGGK